MESKRHLQILIARFRRLGFNAKPLEESLFVLAVNETSPVKREPEPIKKDWFIDIPLMVLSFFGFIQIIEVDDICPKCVEGKGI